MWTIQYQKKIIGTILTLLILFYHLSYHMYKHVQ